jgi:hypothetical protein
MDASKSAVSRVALLFAGLSVLGGCLILPSARPVAYTPHPERVQDPVAVLRETAQEHCAKGVAVEQVGSAVVFTSACDTDFKGRERPERIELARLSNIDIVFGDWYAVRLFESGKEMHDYGALRFQTAEAAIRSADAFWALKQRAAAK